MKKLFIVTLVVLLVVCAPLVTATSSTAGLKTLTPSVPITGGHLPPRLQERQPQFSKPLNLYKLLSASSHPDESFADSIIVSPEPQALLPADHSDTSPTDIVSLRSTL